MRAGGSTFGGLLVRGLAASSERGGAAVSARAARVLAHLLLDNPEFKQRVLAIPLEASPAAAAGPRLLMPRCLANLSQALLSDGAICARLTLSICLQPSAHVGLTTPGSPQIKTAFLACSGPSTPAGDDAGVPCALASGSKHAFRTLRAEGEQGRLAAALILRLLVTWCDGCPPAVGALLSMPSHLPLIVDVVAGRFETFHPCLPDASIACWT